jgi:hypothetical protein
MRKINMLKSLGYPMPPPLMLEGKSIVAATDIAGFFFLASTKDVRPWLFTNTSKKFSSSIYFVTSRSPAKLVQKVEYRFSQIGSESVLNIR